MNRKTGKRRKRKKKRKEKLARCARASVWIDKTGYWLLHENLIAYQAACDLRVVVVQARIRDPQLRDQALRAAKSACLNVAEANGRASPADRRRVFAIARGEATEAAAAVHIAALAGECPRELAEKARRLGGRTVALITGLLR